MVCVARCMYAVKIHSDEVDLEKKINEAEEMKKAKGLKQCVLKKTITFQDYMNCIIRTKKHQVYTISQKDKIALSPYDNKRFILDGNIETLPWGHYKIDENALMNST